MIDYTSENFDEKKAMDYYYYLLANPIAFNKLIKHEYDCVIACNHNAPSYFASYIKNVPKVVWIRGDLSEHDYNRFDANSKEYYAVKQEYEMQKNVFNEFDNKLQLVPFLQKLEKIRNLSVYNNIEVILHYEPLKGHDGLSQEDALKFIYGLLDIEN